MKPIGIAQITGWGLTLAGVILLTIGGQNWLNLLKLKATPAPAPVSHSAPSAAPEKPAPNPSALRIATHAEEQRKRADALYCTISGVVLLGVGLVVMKKRPSVS